MRHAKYHRDSKSALERKEAALSLVHWRGALGCLALEHFARKREYRLERAPGGNRFCCLLHRREDRLDGAKRRALQPGIGAQYPTRALRGAFLKLLSLSQSSPLRPLDGSLCADPLSMGASGMDPAGIGLFMAQPEMVGSQPAYPDFLFIAYLAAGLLCSQLWTELFLQPGDLEPDLFSLEAET